LEDFVFGNPSLSSVQPLLVSTAAQVRSPLNNSGLQTLMVDESRNAVTFTAAGEAPINTGGTSPWSSKGTVVHLDGRLCGNFSIECSPDSLKNYYLTLGLNRLAVAAETLEQFETRLEHYVHQGMDRKMLKGFARHKLACMNAEGMVLSSSDIETLERIFVRFALKDAKEYLLKVVATNA